MDCPHPTLTFHKRVSPSHSFPNKQAKLAAADVFTFDSAYVLLESLRIDAGVLGPFGDHP